MVATPAGITVSIATAGVTSTGVKLTTSNVPSACSVIALLCSSWGVWQAVPTVSVPAGSGPPGNRLDGRMTLPDLLSSLASGRVEVVDLTNPLSARTPTLRLPPPFANLIDFRLEQVSAYDEPGPFWKHHNVHTGEHIGTHLDAPVHWVTGREGHDVSQIPAARLV